MFPGLFGEISPDQSPTQSRRNHRTRANNRRELLRQAPADILGPKGRLANAGRVPVDAPLEGLTHRMRKIAGKPSLRNSAEVRKSGVAAILRTATTRNSVSVSVPRARGGWLSSAVVTVCSANAQPGPKREPPHWEREPCQAHEFSTVRRISRPTQIIYHHSGS